MAVFIPGQAPGGTAHVTAHALNRDLLISGRGLLLLEPEHTAHRMGSGTHQSAAARLIPFACHRTAGAFQALLALHKKQLCLFSPDDLSGLLHRCGINEVFCIHELLTGLFHHLFQAVHLGQALAKHLTLRYRNSDILLYRPAEVSGQRLFADNMLACLHGLYSDGCMQKRRKYDINHFNFRILQQQTVIADRLFIAVALLHLFRKREIQITDSL